MKINLKPSGNYRILILALGAIFFFVASCSDSPTMIIKEVPFHDTAYANITWYDGTVAFSGSDTSAILDKDSTYENITFDGNNEKAKNLKVGDIIFIWGKALKKVASITPSGGNIEVQTEWCALNEAIKDGSIKWNKELNFPPELISNISVDYKHPYTQKVTGNELELEFPVGNGMKGKINLTLEGDKLDAKCEISKKVGVANVVYSMEGFVNKIKNSGNIDYKGGKLKSFNYQNVGVEGEMTLSLVATGSMNDLLGGFELPIVLMKIPILVGGIPCVFNVKILFVINTVMPQLDASAFIKTNFKYNSNTGISYNGTDVGVTANAGPIKMESNKDSIFVGSSADVGINFGFTFPRFEFGIFGETIVPYIHTAFLIGGTYTFGTKPCMTIDADFIGAVGYEFDFLGLLKSSGKKTLWDIKKNLRKSGDCP